jgi:hypothetical protein
MSEGTTGAHYLGIGGKLETKPGLEAEYAVLLRILKIFAAASGNRYQPGLSANDANFVLQKPFMRPGAFSIQMSPCPRNCSGMFASLQNVKLQTSST